MPVSKVTAVAQTTPIDDIDRWATILHDAASVAIRKVAREPGRGQDLPPRPFAELSDSIQERYRMTVKRLIELGYWNTVV